ncbi:RepB family protein [Pantoea agglomerans]|uniref:RepB family protein n=1 Tax=Enterobacter agglomerans TaxID=549 RepID=UPI00100972F9|nr:RepB family protein [Pantoea agglomerans]QAV47593.1 replication protein RepA [Pantoea agglomerans]QAV52203.1 replication protein RepA [Pantoea agglomerans]
MSPRDSETSAPEKKRTRNREQPTPHKDRVRAYKARKRETHKEISVFVRPEIKEALVKICELKGITQADFLEMMIEAEARNSELL